MSRLFLRVGCYFKVSYAKVEIAAGRIQIVIMRRSKAPT